MPSRFPLNPLWVRSAFVAIGVIAGVYAADLLAELEGTTRTVLRIAAIVAAAVAAGTFFQRWSVVPARTVPHHAMAALGLLGGALVASSAFGAGPGAFGNELTASLGLAALVVSLLAARASLASPSGVNR